MFFWRHVTQNVYVVRHGGLFTLETLCNQPDSGFNVFDDLDLWPMFYW